MVGNRLTVLAVDDDARILAMLQTVLGGAGHCCLPAASGEEALRLVEAEQPDVVLLDLRLPGTDGRRVLGRLREGWDTPVIVLTGHGGEQVMVDLLRLGADDYLEKPFSPGELLARLEAVARRSLSGAQPRRQVFAGGLEIDLDAREVCVDGMVVHLTSHEYGLLLCLVQERGRALFSRVLLERVWGPDYVNPEVLRAHMAHLRRKLGDDARHPRYIQTVHGAGYRFVGGS